jgi:hypothetical protein
MDNYEFEVQEVWLQGIDRSGARTLFAVANVIVAPFSFQVEVRPDGTVALPYTLQDPELLHEIITKVRRRVLREFTEQSKRRVAYDKEELARQLKDRQSQVKEAAAA